MFERFGGTSLMKESSYLQCATAAAAAIFFLLLMIYIPHHRTPPTRSLLRRTSHFLSFASFRRALACTRKRFVHTHQYTPFPWLFFFFFSFFCFLLPDSSCTLPPKSKTLFHLYFLASRRKRTIRRFSSMTLHQVTID